MHYVSYDVVHIIFSASVEIIVNVETGDASDVLCASFLYAFFYDAEKNMFMLSL